MADVKISQLPEVARVSSGDVMPVVASGVTSKIQVQNFGASVTASVAISSSYALTASYALNGSGPTFPYTGSAIISGSLIITGSANFTAGLTSSLHGTSSWAQKAVTASYVSGAIGGNGVAGQIAYWNSSNSITGDNNLFFDSVNYRLGLSANIPLHKVDIRTNLSNDTAGVVISNTSATSRAFFSASNDLGYGTVLSQYGSTNPFTEYRNNTVLASSKDLIFVSDNYSSSLGSASVRFFAGGYATTQESMRLFGSTGNLVIRRGGTFVDEGYRLDIIGNTRVSGSLLVVSGITGSLHGTSSWAISSSRATTSSYAVVSATSSYANAFTINGSNLTTQQNSDVDIGTEIIARVSTSSFSSAFFDYFLQDGTNYRAGTVSSVWNNLGVVRYTDTSTTDIGDTSPVTFNVVLTNSTASLQATATTNNWNVKTFVRAF